MSITTIFLPLDNATAAKEDIEGIQTFLLQITKDNFPSVSLPVTWAVFHLILRYKYEESPGVCTLAECTDLAVDCDIQAEHITAIWRWFHENLGTVLYYEEVESFKDFVICNPDMLFSGISPLVTISFATSGDRRTAAEEIRKTGEIPEPVYFQKPHPSTEIVLISTLLIFLHISSSSLSLVMMLSLPSSCLVCYFQTQMFSILLQVKMWPIFFLLHF